MASNRRIALWSVGSPYPEHNWIRARTGFAKFKPGFLLPRNTLLNGRTWEIPEHLNTLAYNLARAGEVRQPSINQHPAFRRLMAYADLGNSIYDAKFISEKQRDIAIYSADQIGYARKETVLKECTCSGWRQKIYSEEFPDDPRYNESLPEDFVESDKWMHPGWYLNFHIDDENTLSVQTILPHRKCQLCIAHLEAGYFHRAIGWSTAEDEIEPIRNIEESSRQDIEENIEDPVEQDIEEDTEEYIEEDAKDDIEENIDDDVEEGTEDDVEDFDIERICDQPLPSIETDDDGDEDDDEEDYIEEKRSSSKKRRPRAPLNPPKVKKVKTAQAAPSKRNPPWSESEKVKLEELVKARRCLEEQNNTLPQLYDTRLWNLMAQQLQPFTNNTRSAMSCKNYWNREGRMRGGDIDRKPAKGVRRSLVTSAQGQEAKAANKLKRATKEKKGKKQQTEEETDDESEVEQQEYEDGSSGEEYEMEDIYSAD